MTMKPTTDIHWASDDSNNVEPASGLKDAGWATNAIPLSSNVNWLLWQLGLYVEWLASLFDSNNFLVGYFDAGGLIQLEQPVSIHTFPTAFWSSNFAPDDQLSSGDGHDNPALISSGSGAAYLDLRIPNGYRLKQVILKCKGNGSNAFNLSVRQMPAATGASVIVYDRSLGGLSATPADQTLNLYAHRGAGTSVVVGGSTGTFTYTRTVGSWITDGFEPGQFVNIAGFTNGANNLTGKEVTIVTALVLTVNDPGLSSPVVETSSAGTFDTLDTEVTALKNMAVLVNAGATAMGVSHLRYIYQLVT